MAEIYPVDVCEHGEMMEWRDEYRRETLLQCQWCGKKVAFPDQMFISMSREQLHHRDDLLLMTFGSAVAERLGRAKRQQEAE